MECEAFFRKPHNVRENSQCEYEGQLCMHVFMSAGTVPVVVIPSYRACIRHHEATLEGEGRSQENTVVPWHRLLDRHCYDTGCFFLLVLPKKLEYEIFF